MEVVQLSLISKGKSFIGKHPFITGVVATIFNRTIGLNKIRIHKGNSIIGLNHSFFIKTKLKIVGTGNTISINKLGYLRNCSFYIRGNNNRIAIGEKICIISGDIYIEDNNNEIIIGDSTAICGYTHIAATEGKKVVIGSDCLFSSDVTIRTGDSHSIVDNEGKRINQAKDVLIGDRVWIGNKAIILKGSVVQSNCIIGSGSVVTKAFEKSNITIAGNPARVIKENINWLVKRI
jgi:acetyltransferase-like isoleucine patch superfamily enzyme